MTAREAMLVPWFRCALLLTIALACLGSVATADEPKAQAEKFSTPEACFAEFAKASRSDNPADLLPFITDVYQDFLIGNLAYQAQRSAFYGMNTKANESLLKKHKLDKTDITELLQIYDSPGRPGAHVAFVLVGSMVKDKSQFVADVATILKEAEGKKPKPDVKAAGTLPTIKDLKVSENTATAVLVGEAAPDQPIYFRRVGDRWLVAMDPKEVSWRKTDKKSENKTED